MVLLLMNSPHFSTQALKRSGIPHIALSGISAEKQHWADRELAMRAAFDIVGPPYRPCSGRSPRGFRWATGLGCCQIIYPSPKSQRSCPGTTAWSWRRCGYGFVLLKNSLDMSGRILTAALLEACSPFDALSLTLPSPSALLHVEVRRDSFAAGHDTDVGNS